MFVSYISPLTQMTPSDWLRSVTSHAVSYHILQLLVVNLQVESWLLIYFCLKKSLFSIYNTVARLSQKCILMVKRFDALK